MNRRKYPLHPAQRDVFTDQLLNVDSPHYNIGGYIRLRGKLDLDRLRHAVTIVPQVFDVFKMRFESDLSEPVFYSADNFTDLPLGELNFSQSQDPQQDALKWMKTRLNNAFVIGKQDLLFEQVLIKISELEHWLFASYHHLVFDGYAFIIWSQYLSAHYKALVAGQEFAHNYPSYFSEAEKAAEYLHSDAYKADGAYWKEKFKDKPASLFHRKLINLQSKSKTSSTYSVVVSADDKKLLDETQQSTKSGLQQLTIAALMIHFGKSTCQTEFSFGIPLHKRGSRQLRNTAGMFAGIIPFKGDFDANAMVADAIRDISQQQRKDYRHQQYLFSDLGRHLKLRSSDESLFDIIVNHEPFNFDLDFGPELDASVYRMTNDYGRNPLLMLWEDYGNREPLQLFLYYRDDYFTRLDIQLLVDRLFFIIKQFHGALDKTMGSIHVLPPAELQLLEKFNAPLPLLYQREQTIVDLFEEQVRRTPSELAVVFEDRSISYSDLNKRSNQLAHYLRSRGVKEDSLVPLCVERSVEMIIGLLGILKAGAAYVPIEQDFPEERKAFVLKDTKAGFVVSTTNAASSIPPTVGIEIIKIDDESSPFAKEHVTPVHTYLRPGHLAYVIYTSGSTGTPKGVMIEHRNLSDYVFGLQKQISIDKCRSYALVSSVATDLGNTVIYSALVFGGSLHIFSKDSAIDAAYMKYYFQRNSIECLKIVPSHWKALSGRDNSLLPSRLLIFGGETLTTEVCQQVQQLATGCRVINHYGPTETTIGKLLHEVKEERMYNTTIPIGRVFSNTIVYVLSQQLSLCPVGIAGELFIGGDGVARGYVNNEQLTEERFIENPFRKGSRLYRTGDMVRWLEDGEIEFIGRVDDQVKIRGYRVELGEIEKNVLISRMVEQVVVLAREDKKGEKALVGYIIKNEKYELETLISYLRQQLPEYMIPLQWMQMERFPMLPNGKTDKRSLPDVENTGQRSQYIAPVTKAQRKLAVIWQELLGIQEVGIQDDFFELGGHSVTAIRMISAIRKEFEVEIPINSIFQQRTIANLAIQLGTASATNSVARITITKRPARIPLSFSQERLWFIDRLQGSVQYHVPVLIKMRGKLNVAALAKAIQMIIERHEILRTVVLDDNGEAFQVVQPAGNWKLQVFNSGEFANNTAKLDEFIQRTIQEPFDLAKDFLLRCNLLHEAADEYLLVTAVHHIIWDAWSASILFKEIVTCYLSIVQGSDCLLPALPLQYADFAIWQRNYLQGDRLEMKLNYWKEKLKHPSPLQLPTDFQRPVVWISPGASRKFKVDKKLASQLDTLSQGEGVTLFMTLLAAFKTLLYKYTSQTDICVGTVIAGRQQQELEHLIGFFVNTLALRTQINEHSSFSQLIQDVKRTTIEAYEHQEVPFEKVVEMVVKERDLSRTPLTQVQFIVRNTPELPEIALPQLVWTAEELDNRFSKFDITFAVFQTEDGFDGSVEFATDLFTEATIDRMIGHYIYCLSQIVTDPDQSIANFQILSNSEQQLILQQSGINEIQSHYHTDTIVDVIERQVRHNASKPAIRFGETTLTYDQLNRKSNQVANLLLKKGIQPGSVVPICIERGAEMIVGIIGILKAGAAYVPIDPYYPLSRINYLLGDIQPSLVLTSPSVRKRLEYFDSVEILELDAAGEVYRDESHENTGRKTWPAQLAYIIYTSGSTGYPKGVMIEHGSLYCSTVARIQYYKEFGSVFLVPSFSFDSSVAIIFGTLASGGTLVLSHDNEMKVPSIIKTLLMETKTILCVPSFYRFILKEGLMENSQMSKVILAGERLDAKLVSEHFTQSRMIPLYNEYGPTEATVWATVAEIPNAVNQINIGRPIPGVSVYILNQHFQLAPVGVVGELYIGGVQVARGYKNLPELTASHFMADLFSGTADSRMYRTGDMGRWLPDGSIEYLGRKDEQVKIRGYRVELAEIEYAIQEIHEISQTVVVLTNATQGDQQLVAYVVAKDFDKEDVRLSLMERLPDYMIPSVWIELDHLPLTPNGKIDKNALPAPDGSATTYIPPRTELEMRLVTIWQQILNVQKLGVEDNFFELGGHSLLAMRMISMIEKDLLVKIPIQAVFRFTTISDLSKYLEIQLANKSEKSNTNFEYMDV